MVLPKDMITVREALEVMKRRDPVTGFPVPFKISWVKLDRQRGTGGQIVEGTAVMEHKGINRKMYRNALRHIRVSPEGRLVPVHIFLIRRMNGKQVV